MKYDNWKTEAIEQYIKEKEQEIVEAKKELERRKSLEKYNNDIIEEINTKEKFRPELVGFKLI